MTRPATLLSVGIVAGAAGMLVACMVTDAVLRRCIDAHKEQSPHRTHPRPTAPGHPEAAASTRKEPAMIPATPGTFAIFEGGEWSEPVLAWDGDGRPLIAGYDDTLTRADTLVGFDSINADAPTPPTTIAAHPGYWALINGERHPVVAWQIEHNGYGRAVALVGAFLRPVHHHDDATTIYAPSLEAPA